MKQQRSQILGEKSYAWSMMLVSKMIQYDNVHGSLLLEIDNSLFRYSGADTAWLVWFNGKRSKGIPISGPTSS